MTLGALNPACAPIHAPSNEKAGPSPSGKLRSKHRFDVIESRFEPSLGLGQSEPLGNPDRGVESLLGVAVARGGFGAAHRVIHFPIGFLGLCLVPAKAFRFGHRFGSLASRAWVGGLFISIA